MKNEPEKMEIGGGTNQRVPLPARESAGESSNDRRRTDPLGGKDADRDGGSCMTTPVVAIAAFYLIVTLVALAA